MADTRQIVSWSLERKCDFRTGDHWFLPDRTATQLGPLRTVASAEGDGRNVGGICVTSWTTEQDNAGTVHQADLKVIVRGLLSALDELGLADPDKDTVKEDAEYLKKKLDGGKPEPGLIRECLSGIRKKLVDAAAAAASSHITTKAGHYLGLIGAFLSKWSGGEG